MAEMLVRTLDKYEGEDLKLQAKSTGRGDVIVVVGDGWQWSAIERTSPEWIIVKCSASLEECQAMRATEQGNELTNPYARVRAFRFDLDAFVRQGHNVPTVEQAKQGLRVESITISEQEFNAAKRRKPPVPDPAVIG